MGLLGNLGRGTNLGLGGRNSPRNTHASYGWLGTLAWWCNGFGASWFCGIFGVVCGHLWQADVGVFWVLLWLFVVVAVQEDGKRLD